VEQQRKELLLMALVQLMNQGAVEQALAMNDDSCVTRCSGLVCMLARNHLKVKINKRLVVKKIYTTDKKDIVHA